MTKYYTLLGFICLFLCSCTMLQDSTYRLVCDYNYGVATTYIGTGGDYSYTFHIHDGPGTLIEKQIWIEEPLFANVKIRDRASDTILSFNQKPSSVIDINWSELFNNKIKSYNQKIQMDLPKEFTRYDGCRIWFLFRNGEILVVYVYRSGEPEEEDISKGFLSGMSSRRIWREQNYILADGTPFDWNECADYFDSHPKATIKDFVKWLKNKKHNGKKI